MSAPQQGTTRDDSTTAVSPVSAADCREQLQRILTSQLFSHSTVLSLFLETTVKEAAAGVEIKGAVLYELIFKVKSGAANASKKALAIPNEGRVRVEAVRLRQKLLEYYATVGANDPVIIDLPKGGYRPVFRYRVVASAVAPKDPPTPVAPELHRPRRIVVMGIGALFLALILGVVAYNTAGKAWELGKPNRPVRSGYGTLRRLTWDGGLAIKGVISNDGKFLAYASDYPDGNLDIYVQEVDGTGLRRITNDASDNYEPSFSPDGSQIAFRSNRNGGGVYLASTLGGEARLVVPFGRRPRFSPNGQYLMYRVGRRVGPYQDDDWGARLFVQPVAEGKSVQIAAQCIGISPAIWSPDSQRILFQGTCMGQDSWTWIASRDGKNIQAGASLESLKTAAGMTTPEMLTIRLDQWLANPSRVLASMRRGDATLESTIPISENGRTFFGPLQSLSYGPSTLDGGSASANGKILISTLSSSVNLWRLPIDATGHAQGDPVPLTNGFSQGDKPALSRDGKFLVFTSWRSVHGELQLMNLRTGAVTPLSVSHPRLDGAILNARGTRVSYYDGSMLRGSAYEMDTAGGVEQTIEKETNCINTDWSPDERSLLCSGLTGERSAIRHLDRESFHEMAFLSDPARDLYQGHFSSDGRWVVFNAADTQRYSSQIYIAPFRPETVPASEWIAVTDDSEWNDKPRFSADGKLLFFTSDRDGHRCIWAQPLLPTMRPAGRPFVVYHSHSPRRSLANIGLGNLELAVAPGMLVFNQGESTGEIWLLDPNRDDPR